MSFRLGVVLCAMAMTAGCIPRPLGPASATVDLNGTWTAAPDPARSSLGTPPFFRSRLVIDDSAVLNPFGPDCPHQARFEPQPPIPFADLVLLHQWPLSWVGTLADGAAMVQEVVLTCGPRPSIRLTPLTPDMALLTLDNGAALVMRRTALRPG